MQATSVVSQVILKARIEQFFSPRRIAGQSYEVRVHFFRDAEIAVIWPCNPVLRWSPYSALNAPTASVGTDAASGIFRQADGIVGAMRLRAGRRGQPL